jgi:putative ABC transport system substrate-binding protein
MRMWSFTVRCFAILAISQLLIPFHAAAQQPTPTVYRLGMLHPGSQPTPPLLDAFLQSLRTLGYVEGGNLEITYRNAEGQLERLPALAADLVQLNVDVIVTAGTHSTAAAQHATRSIPIVVLAAGDLVGAGLVASLAQPGGNITGSTDVSPDASGKRLEFLRQALPQVSRVAVLWGHPNPGDRKELRATEAAAASLGITMQSVEVNEPQEFPRAYAAMIEHDAQAVILILGSFLLSHRRELLHMAMEHRLPSICEPEVWAQDGCLLSYGPDLAALWRRAATYVDKILRGAKPADLPVEQPTRYILAINLKTAQRLGITIPPLLLFQANKVIQ